MSKPKLFVKEGCPWCVDALNYFKLKSKKPANLYPWKKITKITLNTKRHVNIAIIGKYVELKDAYKSLDEALTHGGISNNLKVNLVRIDSEKLKVSEIKNKLKNVSGILIPGGFGKRGTEGKIEAIRYARINKIPFLGICYGMQMAIIEFARNQLKIKKATSSEFDKGGVHIIGLMHEWEKSGRKVKGTDKDLGGTMRLGSYDAILKDKSKIRDIYKSRLIKERHRHRYEVNPLFKEHAEKADLNIVGTSVDGNLVEMVELPNHKWFLGCQFHPEFTSNPRDGHPIFNSYIKSTIDR